MTPLGKLLSAVILGALCFCVVKATAEPPKPVAECDCCKCKNCACQLPPVAKQVPQQMPPKKDAALAVPVAFETALRAELAKHPDHPHTGRVLKVLNMEPGERRTRILARMEKHVGTHLDVGDVAGFDWSSVDWAKLFDTIVKLIMAILPFLGL